MIRIYSLAALCFSGLMLAGTPAQDAVFRHVREIRNLSSEEAKQQKKVHLKGVVTALSGWRNSFFVEESGTGISVDRTDSVSVLPGDEVEIEGVTGEGLFAPIISASRVHVVGHGVLPPAVPVTLADVAGGGKDSQRVAMHGVVHSAQVTESQGRQVLVLLLDIGGDTVSVRIRNFPHIDFQRLIDSEIRVKGVCGSQFNDRNQFVGLRLFVSDFNDLTQEKEAAANPFSRPESSLSSLFRLGTAVALRHQVKVAGTVTYAQDGGFYLQAAEAGLLVETKQEIPAIGERVEAVGFVAPGGYSPVLSYARIMRTGDAVAPIAAAKVAAAQLIQAQDGFVSTPYDGRLVQVDARLVERARGGVEEVWILSEGDLVFQARMPLRLARSIPANVQSGARLRITGICAVEANQAHEPTEFYLLPRELKDVVLLSVPWWTLASSLTAIVILVFLFLGLLAWILSGRIEDHDGERERSTSVAKLHIRCREAAEWCGLIAATMGLVFVFYTQYTLSASTRMAPSTAMALVFLGLALYVKNREAMTSEVPRLVKILSACSLFLAVTMWIDRLEPFYETAGRFRLLKAIVYQRMAWPSVVTTILLSLACLLGTGSRAVLVRQVLALIAGTIALLNTVAYLFGIKDLFWLAPGANMAIFSSLAFLLLSFGICLSSPEAGLMAPLMSSGLGGVLGRRLLPPALLVPMTLGWATWQGQVHSVFSAGVCMALFVLACILVFAFLISINVRALERMQHLKRLVSEELFDSEERFRDTFERAAVGIAHLAPDGRFMRVNTKMCSTLGYTASELEKKRFDEIADESDLQEHGQNAQSLLNGTASTYTTERLYHQRNGNSIRLRLTVSLVWKGFGEPDYFVAIFQDVNETKKGSPERGLSASASGR